jgi:hypothetical protein
MLACTLICTTLQLVHASSGVQAQHTCPTSMTQQLLDQHQSASVVTPKAYLTHLPSPAELMHASSEAVSTVAVGAASAEFLP